MFLIFIKQVISQTNNGLLMGIRGGFLGNVATLWTSGEPPSLLHQKKYSVVQNELNL